MSELLGVAVLGAGHMGADHIRRLDRVVSGARVAAVADPDAERAEEAVAGIDGVTVHTDAEAALDAPGVEAVLIASPGEAHEAALLAAFDRGLPVLCEKPMVPDPAGALRVVEAEARLGRRLAQIGFMRRFDAEYRQLKALLDGGRLGRPLMLHCVHRNVSSPPRFTSAMLIDSSVSHEIDAARWLLGQELTAVTVLRPAPSSGAPEGLLDPQFVLLEAERGALVDVEVFVNCGFAYEVRCEAVCEAGSARIGDARSTVVTAAGRRSEEVPQDYVVRFADAYDRQVRAWVDATRRGRVTGPSAWDGYAASAVAAAGVRALESGARTPVALARARPCTPTPEPGLRTRARRTPERSPGNAAPPQVPYGFYDLTAGRTTPSGCRSRSAETMAYADGIAVSCVAKSLTPRRELCNSRNGPSLSPGSALAEPSAHRSASCRPISPRTAPPPSRRAAARSRR